MVPKSLFLLVPLVGITFTLGWFFALRSQSSLGDSLVVEARVQERSEPPRATELANLPANEPRSTLPSAKEAVSEKTEPPEITLKAAFEQLTRAIRKEVVWDGSDQLLAQKYHSASREELDTALVIVGGELKRERERLINERIALGIYEEYKGAAGENRPEFRSPAGGGLVSYGFVQENRGGSLVTRVTTLPDEEYPEFHSLGMEWMWLHQQTRPPPIPSAEAK